jgi:hypothetical protein
VAEKLLDGANVIPILEQMCCEAVAQRVNRRPLRESDLRNCLAKMALKTRSMKMVPPHDSAAWVN